MLNASAILAAAGGFYAIYANKNVMGKEHFTSIHSKLGLATLASTAALSVGGGPLFYKTIPRY